MARTQHRAEQAIRLILAAHNKSQAWLAQQLGESPFWVARRLNGVVNFDVEDLDRVARVLGTDLAGLLQFTDNLPQIQPAKEIAS